MTATRRLRTDADEATSGRLPAPPSRRLRAKWIVVAGAGLAGIWVAFVGVSLWQAQADARAARSMVDDLSAELELDDLDDPRLARDLRGAEARFARANDRVDGPLFAPVRVLPVVGRQVRSFDSLSGAAEQSVGIARGLAEQGRELVERRIDSSGDRIEVIRALEGLTASAAGRLDAIDLGPDDALFGPLADARRDLEDELADFRGLVGDGRALAGAAADLLEGPRRYLLFGANNAEMRAGSGMFLFAGELGTVEGRFDLVDPRSVTEIAVPPGAVTATGDFADRWGWLEPTTEWRNLMTSPRFPASAELAAQMWEAGGEAPVDGVMAIDALAIREILGVTGPVSVGGREIGAGDVVDELVHDQYERFPDLEARPERRDILGDLAAATFEAVDAGDWDTLDMADALADAVRGRHLMLWSSHSVEQDGWTAGDAAGELTGDSLLLSVLNRGANKLDPFLRVAGDLDVDPDTGEAALRIRIRNTTPAGEPQYVAGPNPGVEGLDAGDHRVLVAVTLPGWARNARFDGVGRLAVNGADGPTRVVAHQLDVRRGETGEVTVSFDVPDDRRTLRVEPSAREPATRWQFGERSWRDREGQTISW